MKNGVCLTTVTMARPSKKGEVSRLGSDSDQAAFPKLDGAVPSSSRGRGGPRPRDPGQQDCGKDEGLEGIEKNVIFVFRSLIRRTMADKLYLIDGHNLIFKMYYAFLRRPMINSKGMDMSILYGFTKYVL